MKNVTNQVQIASRSNRRFTPVRFALLVVVISMTCTQTGCQIFDRFRASEPHIPTAFQQPPDRQQLIAHLNARAEKVKQLKASVRVAVDGMPTLRGTLAVERPKRLRLKAGLLGVSEMGVDVGSNDDRFWIWTRVAMPGETPSLYYANHEAYQRSAVRRAISLEPAWLIDSLGLTSFLPGEQHEGPFAREDGRVEIRTHRQTVTGPELRICVVDPQTGLVSQQSTYDANGRLIAYANSISYQLYPEAGISLPQRMELYVFPAQGQSMKLVVDAESYEINSLYGDPDLLWSMPQPRDIPMINIARNAIQTTAGTGQDHPPAGAHPGAIHQNAIGPGTIEQRPLQQNRVSPYGNGSTSYDNRNPGNTSPATGRAQPNYGSAGGTFHGRR